MKEYTKQISEYISATPENEIIEASKLHDREFSEIPEAAFYKALERLCKSGILSHVTKGLYYRPKETRFGQVPISDREIAEHYLSNGQGIVVGYHMYNSKGITTQIGKNIEVLSNSINGKIKNAGNVKIQYAGVEFTSETVPVVEALEILQNYSRIENASSRGLAAYMTDFAEKYSDEAAGKVLSKRKYKKSTIAFMKEFLDFHRISNGLGKYLSSLSDYSIPSVEALYETE